jgi:multidrug transporter EmrE-like cation transporter
MMSELVQIALASRKSSEIALAVISSPFIVVGLVCFGLSAVIWLFVLSKIPVSSAYPFIALGIVATTVFGHFMFNEPITAYKAVGLCLILSGILLIGKVG